MQERQTRRELYEILGYRIDLDVTVARLAVSADFAGPIRSVAFCIIDVVAIPFEVAGEKVNPVSELSNEVI